MILQKRDDVSLYKAIKDIRHVIEHTDLKLMFINENDISKTEEIYSTTLNVANKFDGTDGEQQLVITVFDQGEDDDIEEFDFICKGKGLICSLYIDDLSGCEEVLLDFLYEYMKINPDVVLWNDGFEWVYTYSDILNAKNKEFDKLWCYKKPQ